MAPIVGLPRFPGGLAGYFGYDTVRYIEKQAGRYAPSRMRSNTPDILLLLTEELAVVDNLSGKIDLDRLCRPAQPHAYEQAAPGCANCVASLRQPFAIRRLAANEGRERAVGIRRGQTSRPRCERAKRYILDGDIMQVVLSQRMSSRSTRLPLSLYRALRSLNPSPYMFYYDMGDFHVVGSSPEILVRLEGRIRVTARPIAGTRPRGKTPRGGRALAKELLADPKERAEHVMLMDLGRNDVGRVAKSARSRSPTTW